MSTDITNDSHLFPCDLNYVRFINNNNFVKHPLVCRSITATAKVQNLFDISDICLLENGIV